ncbi:MAG TPA: Ku protein [Candidatus Acidoferrales bacterium]|nr:Ku protein [Candidatus Acidoferrales bacterium]
MARRKAKTTARASGAKAPSKLERKAAARAIWKGSISFGLVNIPVALRSAVAPARLDFDLLDRRDFSPIRYRRVSEKSGREVPWEETIKGYQYEKGEYVALTDEDFREANVEATQTIDIMDFVDGAAISPVYYDTPYYLEPLKGGERAYALLREVLARTGKVGIAKVVIRTRQHLAAVMPQERLLILNLLRFQHELRDASNLALPELGAKRLNISDRELKMAERLVETMLGEWKPEKYRDEYTEDLMRLVERKIESGQTKAIAPAGKRRAARRAGKVIDIMDLLQRSVEQARKGEPERRKAS